MGLTRLEETNYEVEPYALSFSTNRLLSNLVVRRKTSSAIYESK